MVHKKNLLDSCFIAPANVMNPQEIINHLDNTKHVDLQILLNCLQSVVQPALPCENSLFTEIIDVELLHEINNPIIFGNTWVGFGKSLSDLKCVIEDEQGERQHEVFLKYKAPKKFAIASTNLPHSVILSNEYVSLQHIVSTLKKYVSDLSHFFYELEQIDRICTVMEPIKPTFKDDYRRILLDERTWLHVEVSLDGSATNVHLIGHSDYWNDKLQEGLIMWDHDKNIVDNIMRIFDIVDFPVPGKSASMQMTLKDYEAIVELPVCSICLCRELPNLPSVPQPLCQNLACGMHFHRSCLFEWLVACAGNRPPTFGVIAGACPACLQSISCSGKDI